MRGKREANCAQPLVHRQSRRGTPGRRIEQFSELGSIGGRQVEAFGYYFDWGSGGGQRQFSCDEIESRACRLADDLNKADRSA